MTFRSKTVPLLLVLLSGAVPVLLGLQLGWPGWVTVFPALALVAGLSLLVVHQSTEARREDDPYRPDPSPVTEPGTPPYGTAPVPSPFTTALMAPPEPPFNEKRVDHVRLASARADYTFVFSATVWWRPLGNDAGPAQPGLADLAESTVLSRAQAVVGREDPEQWEAVHRRLQGELGFRQNDPSDLITVLADGISLTLDEDDRLRLEKLSQLRKDEEDWERNRHFERSRRAYLGDEVLKTPGTAVVWWLARHDERVKDAVNMIGPLAQLSAAANDTDIPEPFRHVVAGYPDRESYLATVGGTDTTGTDDDAEYTGRAPMPDEARAPFSGDRAAGSSDGAYEGLRHTPYTPGEPGPHTATAPDSDPVDRIAGLLDELGLKEGSPEREAYVERIARTTEAAGLPEQAERIRQRLAPDRCPPPGTQPPFTDPTTQPPGDRGTLMGEGPAPDSRPGGPAADTPRGRVTEEDRDPGPVTEEHRDPDHPEQAPTAPTSPFDRRPGDGYEEQRPHEGRSADAPLTDDNTGAGYTGGDARSADGQPATPHSAPEAASDDSRAPAPQASPYDVPGVPSPSGNPDRPGAPGHDPRHGYGTPPEQAPDGGYAPPPNDAPMTGHPGADGTPPANAAPPADGTPWWGGRPVPPQDGPAAPPAGPPAAPPRVWAMPPADSGGQATPAAADQPEPPHEGGPHNPHTPGFG
ncbi:hypothetical protein ACGH2B_11845 [Streptomyces sp. BBFR2]|uniref:hypothetical protein n=1 Tax=Streptomyces sp. BBFR2 TaxID=3372854 RepID=UPI0037DA5FB7